MNSIELKMIDLAKEFGITDQLELAHLLAQFAHESANFTTWSEAEKFRYIVNTKVNYLLNSININLYQYITVLKIGCLKLR